jgi:hypothetical protein
MKRFFMLAAAVILSASWASPGQAQLGIGGFGGALGPLGQIEAARSQLKLKNQQYTKAKPRAVRRPSARPATSSSHVDSLDRFGRRDLAGRAVAGYPAIRGNLDNMQVSRGGANGTGGRRSARRSK